MGEPLQKRIKGFDETNYSQQRRMLNDQLPRVGFKNPEVERNNIQIDNDFENHSMNNFVGAPYTSSSLLAEK